MASRAGGVSGAGGGSTLQGADADASVSPEQARILVALASEMAAHTQLAVAIVSVLDRCREMISADRMTLFLVDSSTSMLSAGVSRGNVGSAQHSRLMRTHIPLDGTSLAGFVASTGQSVLVPDAYADPRFNRQADEATGYTTRSLVAVPVIVRGSGSGSDSGSSSGSGRDRDSGGAVLGVLQGLNKVDGSAFTASDEACVRAVSSLAGSILLRLMLADSAERERHTAQQLMTLIRTVSEAATTGGVPSVLDAVTAATYALLAPQRVTLFLCDDSRQALTIARSKDAEGLQIPLSQGLAGACALSGITVVTDDAYGDSRFNPSVDAATGFMTRTVLAVPIRDHSGGPGGGRVLGVLQAINRTQNSRCVVTALRAAFAAAHISLFEETPADAADSSSSSTSGLGLGPAAAALGDAVHEGRLTRLTAHTSRNSDGSGATTDTAEEASATVYPFTASDVDVLESMASHAAVALANARALEDAVYSRRTTRALLDIVRCSSSVGDGNTSVATLIQKIVDAAYALLDCERVTLYLVDSLKQELWMAVTRDREAVGTRIPLGKGLAGWVAAKGAPLNIADAYRDARFDSSVDLATGFRTRSVLVWPITLSPTSGPGDTSGGAGTAPIAVLQALNKRAANLLHGATTARKAGGMSGSATPLLGAAAAAATAAGPGTSRGRSSSNFSSHQSFSEALEPLAIPIPHPHGHHHHRTHHHSHISSSGTDTMRSTMSSTGSSFVPEASGLGGGSGAAAAPAADADVVAYTRFDKQDERAVAALCAEVAVALKRRSVETAFLKALDDSARSSSSRQLAHAQAQAQAQAAAAAASAVPGLVLPLDVTDRSAVYASGGSSTSGAALAAAADVGAAMLSPSSAGAGAGAGVGGGASGAPGTGPSDAAFAAATTPEEFNVSLMSLYSDAGTTARLHTSVLVRRMSLQSHVSWPVGLSLRRQPSSLPSGPNALDSKDADTATPSATAPAAIVPNADEEAGSSSAVAQGGTSPTAAAVNAAAADSSSPLAVVPPVTDAVPGGFTSLITPLPGAEMTSEEMDELFSWRWNIFAAPLTGLSQQVADPSPPISAAPRFNLPHQLTQAAVMAGEQRLALSVLAMFNQFSLLSRFGIDERKFLSFVHAVRSKYHPNPFHNWYHGVSVLHAVVMLIGSTSAADMLSYRDILCAMIAAYAHDVDHPGHNNAYEVATFSPLALAHNDDAVLERHHAHVLFQVLFDPRYAILAGLPAADLRECRKTIVRAILHTDMTKHFSTVSELAARSARWQSACKAAGMDDPACNTARSSGGGDDDVGSDGESGSGSRAEAEGDGDGTHTARSSTLSFTPTPTASPSAAGMRGVDAAVTGVDSDDDDDDDEAGATPALRAPATASTPAAVAATPPGMPPLRSLAAASVPANRGLAQMSARRRSFAARTPLQDVSTPVSDSVGGGGGGPCDQLLPFDRAREEERSELVSVLVHTADLGGQAYPAAVSRNWSCRILWEFKIQASRERSLGLPVAPFMSSLDTPVQCARLQLSFVSNIVLPLWERVGELLTGMEEPLGNLQAARKAFEVEIAGYEAEEASAATAAAAGPAAAPAATSSTATPAPATATQGRVLSQPLAAVQHVSSSTTR